MSVLASSEEATTTAAPNAVRSRYERIAWLYDFYDAPMNRLGGLARRRRVVGRAVGSILEVGIGTGANLSLYPTGADLTGIDISARMLERARHRAARLGMRVPLLESDVERLPFSDATFDTVVATCVFCSVEHPVEGLRELGRVVKPEGRVLMLEHVRPENPFLGWLADRISPLTQRLIGPEMNRKTEENVIESGLQVLAVKRQGIWREIEAIQGSRAFPGVEGAPQASTGSQ